GDRRHVQQDDRAEDAEQSEAPDPVPLDPRPPGWAGGGWPDAAARSRPRPSGRSRAGRTCHAATFATPADAPAAGRGGAAPGKTAALTEDGLLRPCRTRHVPVTARSTVRGPESILHSYRCQEWTLAPSRVRLTHGTGAARRRRGWSLPAS